MEGVMHGPYKPFSEDYINLLGIHSYSVPLNEAERVAAQSMNQYEQLAKSLSKAGYEEEASDMQLIASTIHNNLWRSTAAQRAKTEGLCQLV